jgi:hypothetical protein
MTFPWSAKSERTEPERTAESSPAQPEGPGDLKQLIAALGRVGELVAAANEKILAGLAQRESPGASVGSGVAVPAVLQEKIEAVEGRFAALAAQVGDVAQAVHRLQEQFDRAVEHLAEILGPQSALASSEAGEVSLADWEQAVLGRDMAAHPSLGFQRHQLLSGVLEGNAAACALAGQLLVFRSAPAERLAPLLKDIGEAYYRWQPKTRPGASPFEESLAGWLQRTCEAAGLHNTIELVHPGERFDATRHNATSRGVEITEVLGWIVLRDNGKVYTKANVAVR